MNNNYILLVTMLIPLICGLFLLIMRKKVVNTALINIISVSSLAATLLSALLACADEEPLLLWRLNVDIAVYFRVDDISRLFVVLAAGIWLLAGIYAIGYMHVDEKRTGFFGFYLLAEGMIVAICFAGNIITYYVFFEFMTLLTFPLVMHDGTHEAISAGLKYLFYSIAGAFMSLAGIFLLSGQGGLGAFSYGGILTGTATGANPPAVLYIAAMLMIVGLGTKAGMWPMHSWLPAAHPEAPAPASAVLSGIITKTGVLGLIRVVYYVIGPDLLRGTWVQITWIVLALITILLGSMMAYRTILFKRRLAYSTVSQVAYVILGLAMMNDIAYQGALLHVVAHALIKTALFMIAGIYIHETGCVRTDGYGRIGDRLPATAWCMLISSIGLVGIPPLSGFVSKWYIGLGAFRSGLTPFTWIGPMILLISALLTAGYLLPMSLGAFFERSKVGSEGDGDTATKEDCENGSERGNNAPDETPAPTPSSRTALRAMCIPVVLLTVLTVLLGLMPNIVM